MEKLNALVEKYKITESDLYKLSVIEKKKSETGYLGKEKLKAKIMGVLKPYKLSISDTITVLKEIPNLGYYSNKELVEKYGEVNFDSAKSSSNIKVFLPVIAVIIIVSIVFQLLTDETACSCANILQEKQEKLDEASKNAVNGDGNVKFDNNHWLKRGKRCMEKYTKMKQWQIEAYQNSGNLISDEAIENARKECGN